MVGPPRTAAGTHPAPLYRYPRAPLGTSKERRCTTLFGTMASHAARVQGLALELLMCDIIIIAMDLSAFEGWQRSHGPDCERVLYVLWLDYGRQSCAVVLCASTFRKQLGSLAAGTAKVVQRLAHDSRHASSSPNSLLTRS